MLKATIWEWFKAICLLIYFKPFPNSGNPWCFELLNAGREGTSFSFFEWSNLANKATFSLCCQTPYMCWWPVKHFLHLPTTTWSLLKLRDPKSPLVLTESCPITRMNKTTSPTHMWVCIEYLYMYIYMYMYNIVYIIITVHYITLNDMTWHDTTLHYITLPYITPHCIILHYTTLRYIT